MEKKIDKETLAKQSIAEKVSTLKDEIKNFESGEGGAVVSKWKNKFKDLFEICQGLSMENAQLVKVINSMQKPEEGKSRNQIPRVLSDQGELLENLFLFQNNPNSQTSLPMINNKNSFQLNLPFGAPKEDSGGVEVSDGKSPSLLSHFIQPKDKSKRGMVGESETQSSYF
mmetsp:Transcript_736/g.791  ORF Transcript_736/g.791 Transcript_736/m.791 type:complete len:170 (+) Transcript_736:1044-1553(+)